MSCDNCGPSPHSIEYTRQYKPQSNIGCGCGGRDAGSCKTPSLAPVGSPLYEWEQIYGKLVETVTWELNEWGDRVQVVTKTPCPPSNLKSSSTICRSLRYKVTR